MPQLHRKASGSAGRGDEGRIPMNCLKHAWNREPPEHRSMYDWRRRPQHQSNYFFEFRSRDTISLNVNLSAPPVTPTPTPASMFTILLL